MHFILYIALYALFYMHCIICIVSYALFIYIALSNYRVVRLKFHFFLNLTDLEQQMDPGINILVPATHNGHIKKKIRSQIL
jgi:hypothetical protein